MAIYYLVSKIVERALLISEKIQSGDIPLDIVAVTEIVSKQSDGADTHLLKISTVVFIICWLFGVVDSFRVVNSLNKRNKTWLTDKTMNIKFIIDMN